MEKIECCNIWSKECYVTINDSEKLCPVCKGHGAFFIRAHYKQGYFDVRRCRLCEGDGKVDWITYITRKPQHIRIYQDYPSYEWIKRISMKCHRNKGCKKIKRLFIEQQRHEKK